MELKKNDAHDKCADEHIAFVEMLLARKRKKENEGNR